MSVRMMSAVWELALPAFEKLVLLALADCANDEGECWPSIATLKRKTGAGERTIQRAIRALELEGVVERKETIGKGNRYWLHPRHTGTPARAAPVSNRHHPPPERRPTPARAAPKPSKNHQEPSKGKGEADSFTHTDVLESYNEIATACGLALAERMTAPRMKAYRARKREYPDPESWRAAFRTLRRVEWLHGKNDREWRADLDFFLQAKSFTKLVEGSYGKAN